MLAGGDLIVVAGGWLGVVLLQHYKLILRLFSLHRCTDLELDANENAFAKRPCTETLNILLTRDDLSDPKLVQPTRIPRSRNDLYRKPSLSWRS